MTLAITVKEAKAALAQMKKLTPARPRLDDDVKLSLKEAVSLMAPDLIAMNKKGFTLKELADGLQAQNIPIKPATLNRYLNEYRIAQTETEKTPETPREEMKEPAADSETVMAQESAEAAATSEGETKAKDRSLTEGKSPPSETAKEKSENIPLGFRTLFGSSQEKNPPGPYQERHDGFRM